MTVLTDFIKTNPLGEKLVANEEAKQAPTSQSFTPTPKSQGPSMMPTTAEELDKNLGIMQTKGATKQQMQAYYDAFKAHRQTVAAQNLSSTGVKTALTATAGALAAKSQGKLEGVEPYQAPVEDTGHPVSNLIEKGTEAIGNIPYVGKPLEYAAEVATFPVKAGVVGTEAMVGAGVESSKKIYQAVNDYADFLSFKPGTEKKGVEGLSNLVSGVLGIMTAPIAGGIEATGEIPGVGEYAQKAVETGGAVLTPSTYTDKIADKIAESKGLTEGTPEYEQFIKDVKEPLGNAANVLGLLLAPKAGKAMKPTISEASEAFKTLKTKVSPDVVTKRATELQSVIDQNKALRNYVEKQNLRGIDVKENIINTDLLQGAVDKEGVIRTKGEGGAVSQYKEFLAPQEKVISQTLDREGAKLSLPEVERQLTESIMDSSLEGKALTKALADVKSEIEGYKLRADKDGNVPVSLINDAKISKYSGINYLSDTAQIDKIIAKSLKEMVEKNTKSADVKALNAELAKHYATIDFLERLDGIRVKGGRLGKYFAKTIGGIAGSSLGPVGAIIGAEIAGALQGKGLSKTFGKGVGTTLDQSPLMKSILKKSQSSLKNEGALKINQSTTANPTKNPIK